MIYEPREDSELLEKYVKKFAFGSVLDVGTGSGVQAVAAAKKKNVRNAIAVDVDRKTIEYCKKNMKDRKIEFRVSDLFSKIKDKKFDTIVFNPPYLPAMEGEEKNVAKQVAGGKHGYEILERFFSEVGKYLKDKGAVLVVFSSLTNKNRVDEVIERNGFAFVLLEEEKLFFERLYCYKVVWNDAVLEVKRKGVRDLQYFSRGKRGLIFVGKYKGKKVAIKLKRKESLAVGRIKNEIFWLRKLNKYKIGPKVFIFSKDFIVYEFVRGDFIVDFIEKNKKEKIKKAIKDVFSQCFVLDKLKVNKEEMHHPLKHVIVRNGKAILVDFERAHKAKKVQNVTQFVQFVCSLKDLLGKKGFRISVNELRNLAREYKSNTNERNFKNILNKIN